MPAERQRWTRPLVAGCRRSHPGVCVIGNMFFRPPSTISPAGPLRLDDWLSGDVDCQLKDRWENYIYPYNVRFKYFVWTKSVVMVRIHFPYELIDGERVQTVCVDAKTAMLHHHIGRRRPSTILLAKRDSYYEF